VLPSSPVLYRYRVTIPFLAVHPEPEWRSKFVTLSAGMTISTANDLHEPGLVEVYSGSETLLVFARDLAERSEFIGTAESPPG
jgi:hypothetical protein